jgi:hypothetical protein
MCCKQADLVSYCAFIASFMTFMAPAASGACISAHGGVARGVLSMLRRHR